MTVTQQELGSEQLEMRWVKVSDAVNMRFGSNPRTHDLASITASIKRHGFKTVPHYDETLGGIDDGNGRVFALHLMEANGEDMPRGITMDGDGSWMVQISFGVDSLSEIDAHAYVIDVNNAGFTRLSAEEVSRLYDGDRYQATLAMLAQNDALPETVSEEEANSLFDMWASQSSGELEIDFGDLDEDVFGDFDGSTAEVSLNIESQVRQQVLFYNGVEFSEFQSLVDEAAALLGTSTTQETVLEVLRAYCSREGEGES